MLAHLPPQKPHTPLPTVKPNYSPVKTRVKTMNISLATSESILISSAFFGAPEKTQTNSRSAKLSLASLLFYIRGTRVDDLRVVRVDLTDEALLLELPDGRPCQRPINLQALHQSRGGDELHLKRVQTGTKSTAGARNRDRGELVNKGKAPPKPSPAYVDRYFN